MKTMEIIKSSARIVTNAGLSIVGKILDKSGFHRMCNDLPVAKAHPEVQITCADILATSVGILCSGHSSFESVREFDGDKDFYQDALGISRIPSAERLRQRLDAAAAEDEANEQEQDPAVFSLAGHSRARILVAEDEPVNQQVIGKLLGMAGYSYDIAENGEKAVELFKQKEYKAALFDVQMPVMDGLAETQEIRDIEMRENRKRLPIIAVTARAMFGDKERILEAKLDDYIAKPYNLNDVVETLNKYVDAEEK